MLTQHMHMYLDGIVKGVQDVLKENLWGEAESEKKTAI